MHESPESKTPPAAPAFDASAYPPDTLFYDRRSGIDRRGPTPPPPAAPTERRRTDRRKRVDPTTFEKQYSTEEIDFMNAMHAFKQQTGKAFPSHREVLGVALGLGYRKTAEPGPSPADRPGPRHGAKASPLS
jgi:hypothetical protein